MLQMLATTQIRGAVDGRNLCKCSWGLPLPQGISSRGLELCSERQGCVGAAGGLKGRCRVCATAVFSHRGDVAGRGLQSDLMGKPRGKQGKCCDGEQWLGTAASRPRALASFPGKGRRKEIPFLPEQPHQCPCPSGPGLSWGRACLQLPFASHPGKARDARRVGVGSTGPQGLRASPGLGRAWLCCLLCRPRASAPGSRFAACSASFGTRHLRVALEVAGFSPAWPGWASYNSQSPLSQVRVCFPRCCVAEAAPSWGNARVWKDGGASCKPKRER